MSWFDFAIITASVALTMLACRVIPLFALKGHSLPDGVEQALRVRLDGKEDPTVSLHCDKTVAVDEVVKVMNIAKDRNYKLILATQP